MLTSEMKTVVGQPLHRVGRRFAQRCNRRVIQINQAFRDGELRPVLLPEGIIGGHSLDYNNA